MFMDDGPLSLINFVDWLLVGFLSRESVVFCSPSILLIKPLSNCCILPV